MSRHAALRIAPLRNATQRYAASRSAPPRYDDPGLAHPERLALALDLPLRRRSRRTHRAMRWVWCGFWMAMMFALGARIAWEALR